MVGAEVEQHRGLRRELDRVLELKRRGLADDGRRRRHAGHERAERGADVPGHGNRQSGLPVHVPDPLHRRRLAVRPGDGDELVGQQPPGELELAHHRRAARAGRGDKGSGGGHARALDHRRARPSRRGHRCQCASRYPRLQARHVRMAGVDGDDLLPAGRERQRRRHARAGETEHEMGHRAGRAAALSSASAGPQCSCRLFW